MKKTESQRVSFVFLLRINYWKMEKSIGFAKVKKKDMKMTTYKKSMSDFF